MIHNCWFLMFWTDFVSVRYQLLQWVEATMMTTGCCPVLTSLLFLLENLAMARVQLAIVSLDGKHLYQNILMPVWQTLVRWEAPCWRMAAPSMLLIHQVRVFWIFWICLFYFVSPMRMFWTYDVYIVCCILCTKRSQFFFPGYAKLFDVVSLDVWPSSTHPLLNNI